MMKLLPLLKVCFLLLIPVVTTATPIPVQHHFSELINSEVLFKFYQGHYFPAINLLLSARKDNRLTIDDDEYHLLLAGLYISFGLDDEAEKIFKERLTQTDHRKLRNQAMLLIAKLQFKHGLYEKTEKTLKRVQAQLAPKQQEERLQLHGQLLLLRDKYRWSVARLRKIGNKSEWAIYGRYNLAIALIKLNDGNTGQVLLEAIGQMEATTNDMWVLRDRANLALGFWFLENRQDEDGLRVFRRIRLNSPVTSMGLLGLGWAYQGQFEYKAALSTWQRLLDKETSNPAVQEALLTTPYAYLKLGSTKEALKGYEHAIERYQQEIRRLDTNITALQSGTFFKTQGERDKHSNKAWVNWAIRQSVDPSNRELNSMLSSHVFISSISDLQDLLYLKQTLHLWSEELNVFKSVAKNATKGVIKTRLVRLEKERQQLLKKLTKYNEQLKTEQRPSDNLKISTPSDLWVFRDMLFNIDITGKNRHIATGDERQLLRRRQSNLNMIRTFSKRDKKDNKSLETLEKIIHWQNEVSSEQDISLLQKGLSDVEMRLSMIDKREQAMRMLQQTEKSELRAYEKPIAQTLARIDKQQLKLDNAIKTQINHLNSMAKSELILQKNHLKGYLIRAYFSIARIHDKTLKMEGKQR
ncbi:MAG: hypothetical protein L3J28_08985 [Candidatus Polarisedimenticolaceae bacterium]|nr:hypothetical protein [Candidatus Polarisedimenticolaceae bacterium]